MRRLGLVLVSALTTSCAAQDPAERRSEEVVLQAPPPPTPPPAPAQPPSPPPPPLTVPVARPELMAATPDERSPDEYTVVLDTTEGEIQIRVHRSWSPIGADRFYTLVKRGYFEQTAFFRVVPGFMAQFGMHGNPQVNAAWANRTINDEPVAQGNVRGRVTFAKRGMPNSRSNQFFINFGNNAMLDPQGFSAFGEVVDMSVVDRLHDGYGESQPSGSGPRQDLLSEQGNAYLAREFPNLDYIRSARIVTP